MFRRRRPKDQSEQYDEDQYQGGEYDEEAAEDLVGDEDAEQEREPQQARAGGGPWDAAEPFPERDRVDLGSLRVPVGPDYEIQLFMGPEHGAWVTARRGESELQMQAFAASRSDAR